VEKCLLKKTDAPRLLQTCQATSTDGSWVKAQQFCMLATDFLDTRDKWWEEKKSGIKKMIELLEQFLSDEVFFRLCLKFIRLFQNTRKQTAEKLFCNYWIFLCYSLQGGDQAAVLYLDVREISVAVTSIQNDLGILLHF
jgi:hypothetical protein